MWFVARVIDVFDGHLTPVVESGGSLFESDTASTQRRESFVRIPIGHAADSTCHPSPTAYAEVGVYSPNATSNTCPLTIRQARMSG